MNQFVIILISAILTIAVAKPSSDWRIVDGSTAEVGQFPNQISIRKNGEHVCGGSILNEYWLLTAAHCIMYVDVSNIVIVVGTNKLNTGGQFYSVEKLIPHEKFNEFDLHNDIGLIKLNSPIQFSLLVSPIELSTEEIGADVELVFSGWGSTSRPGGPSPNDLQYVNLKSVTSEECNERNQISGLNIDSTQLCTFTRKGQGLCHGDSGGSLIYKGKVVGVFSWILPCALGYPDVFSRITSYSDWIEKNILKY